MNGYTPSTPLKTRLTNLLEQVPQELRNQAAADCMQDNPYDFERTLTSYVVLRTWETNPADTAQQIEREIDWQLEARAADADDADNRRTMHEAAM